MIFIYSEFILAFFKLNDENENYLHFISNGKSLFTKVKILIVDFPFFDFIYTKKKYRQQKKTNHTFHAYKYSYVV